MDSKIILSSQQRNLFDGTFAINSIGWGEWRLDQYLRDGLKKSDRRAPHALRLRALMIVLGFDPDIRGNQPKFAKMLRVETPRLNNALRGYPLSWQLARQIIRRYPRVSTDFLFLGKAGGHLDRELEQQLLDYEEKTGVEVFTRSPEP